MKSSLNFNLLLLLYVLFEIRSHNIGRHAHLMKLINFLCSLSSGTNSLIINLSYRSIACTDDIYCQKKKKDGNHHEILVQGVVTCKGQLSHRPLLFTNITMPSYRHLHRGIIIRVITTAHFNLGMYRFMIIGRGSLTLQ